MYLYGTLTPSLVQEAHTVSEQDIKNFNLRLDKNFLIVNYPFEQILKKAHLSNFRYNFKYLEELLVYLEYFRLQLLEGYLEDEGILTVCYGNILNYMNSINDLFSSLLSKQINSETFLVNFLKTICLIVFHANDIKKHLVKLNFEKTHATFFNELCQRIDYLWC
jgi:hypothetical protein